MVKMLRIAVAVFVMVLSLYGMPYAQDDGGDSSGDAGGDAGSVSDSADVVDTPDAADTANMSDAADADHGVVETTEVSEEYSAESVPSSGVVTTTTSTVYSHDYGPSVVGAAVVGAAAGAVAGSATSTVAKGSVVKDAADKKDRSASVSNDLPSPIKKVKKTPSGKQLTPAKTEASK